MFKKIANWLSDEPAPSKKQRLKKSVAKKPTVKKMAPSAKVNDDPALLIQQAILDAEQTIAMEEKIAGHDKDHLKAVQGAMMIYRQKQESLDDLPLKQKAKLRAMGEVIFGDQLAKANSTAKKPH